MFSLFGKSIPKPSVQPQIQDMIAKRRQAEINVGQNFTYIPGEKDYNASWEEAVQAELKKLSGGKSKRKSKQRKTKRRQ